MDAPPLEPAVKLMFAEPFPGVACKLVGEDGVVGNKTLKVEDAVPAPALFTARN